MNSSLEGRLRKYKLPKSQALLPLFEAVVNSIDSLSESKEDKKFITITIMRESTLLDTTKKDELGSISGFYIEDNGLGFNKKNFEAFKELDTLNKITKGGKGIGRLAWLKAFDDVEITSTYEENSIFMEKKFKFNSKYDDGIDIEYERESSKKESNTVIKIENIKELYASQISKRADIIANKIIEHCLYYFTLNEIKFKIFDEQDSSNLLDLNKIYKEKYNSEKETITIDGNNLNLIKVISHISENKILYCANNRVVKEDKLSKYIVELKTSLPDNKYVQYFIAGNIFDKTVNDERTDFESTLFTENNIDFKKLEEKIISHIDNTLSSQIEQQKEDNRNYLNEYVKKEAPQYIKILRYATEEQIRKVNKGMKSESIDQELFHIKQYIEKDIKLQSKELPTLSEEKIKSLIEKVTALNSANLTEYIIYRKTIIDTLAKYLKMDEKSLENDIHKLIYPMRSTENKDYDDHNLWLIDDKLAFHNFCASDVQFKNFIEDSKSAERPDIVIFDKPFIYAPNRESISSIVLIEFKRPKRNDYSLGKDPISQVLNYLEEITKHNNIIDNDGMTTTIHENIQKQVYIIADLTSTFELIIKKYYSWLVKSSDNTGYFGFDTGSKAYIEIVSYEKLLKDAKNRNKVFFEKLGI